MPVDQLLAPLTLASSPANMAQPLSATEGLDNEPIQTYGQVTDDAWLIDGIEADNDGGTDGGHLESELSGSEYGQDGESTTVSDTSSENMATAGTLVMVQADAEEGVAEDREGEDEPEAGMEAVEEDREGEEEIHRLDDNEAEEEFDQSAEDGEGEEEIDELADDGEGWEEIDQLADDGEGEEEIDPLDAISDHTRPVVDLPYLDQFTILTDLTEHSPAYSSLAARDIDVDRWEVSISPEEYLRRFQDQLELVQIVGRAPTRRLTTPFHRGPAFDRWLLLGKANHQMWVSMGYKKPFFQAMYRYQELYPGRFQNQASLGNVMVSTAVFIHCLTAETDCDTIRLKAYGQKMPLVGPFYRSEPAQEDHRWAQYNMWDIGTTFASTYIWLFASSTGRQRGLKQFRMLVPGSLDYGSVNIRLKHNNRKFSIKIYPKLVHVMKAIDSRLQASVPRTLQGVRDQVAKGLRMLHALTAKNDMELGGFRIEVSVTAPTLARAKQLVEATPFLSPAFWLGIGDGIHSPTPITAKLVTRAGLLANANFVREQANNAGMFEGRGSNKPLKTQIRALTDVLNSLGWNSGLRKSTKSMADDAWWTELPEAPPATVFEALCRVNQKDAEIRELFLKARDAAADGSLPCKKYPGDPSHRYQSNQLQPFTVRCGNRSCHHKLARAALVEWIAKLVDSGIIPKTALLAMESGQSQ